LNYTRASPITADTIITHPLTFVKPEFQDGSHPKFPEKGQFETPIRRWRTYKTRAPITLFL